MFPIGSRHLNHKVKLAGKTVHHSYGRRAIDSDDASIHLVFDAPQQLASMTGGLSIPIGPFNVSREWHESVAGKQKSFVWVSNTKQV